MSKKGYTSTENPAPSTVNEAAVAYNTPFQKVHLTRAGVSTEFVLDLMRSYKFSKQTIAQLAGISPKTLDRHLQSERKFIGLQADRLLQLAELYSEGLDLFEDREKFLKWLSAKLPALNGTAPKEWLDTHHGISMISDEIDRIKHGIFA